MAGGASSSGALAAGGTETSETMQKVIMLGSGGVGKSALTLQFMYGDFVEEYDPTKVDSYRTTMMVDGQQLQVNILDTAGQEEYEGIRDNHYRSGEGFLCVFSLCERESFDRTIEIRDQLMRVLSDDEDVPFALVGNKSDLAHLRTVFDPEPSALAKLWHSRYFTTSAKTGENVSEAFTYVVSKIHSRKLREAERQGRQKQQDRAGCFQGKCKIL